MSKAWPTDEPSSQPMALAARPPRTAPAKPPTTEPAGPATRPAVAPIWALRSAPAMPLAAPASEPMVPAAFLAQFRMATFELWQRGQFGNECITIPNMLLRDRLSPNAKKPLCEGTQRLDAMDDQAVASLLAD